MTVGPHLVPFGPSFGLLEGSQVKSDVTMESATLENMTIAVEITQKTELLLRYPHATQ